MKVFLGKPRYHWISPYSILETVFFWRKIDYDEPLIENLAELLLPLCEGIQWVWDKVQPEVNIIKIDKWDTWSMDHTLSPIILPMLKQLKETKHGYGLIDDEDVPKHLRSIYSFPESPWEWDGNAEARYDYVLNEMIWSFEQLCDDNSDKQFFDHSAVDSKDKDFVGQLRNIKIDHAGLKAHNARIDNGLKLFGKYFRTLWD
jgi:hypothetical protein